MYSPIISSVVRGNMGHFLGFLKLTLYFVSAGVIILSTNHHIRAFAILAAYLEDNDTLEWIVFPWKTYAKTPLSKQLPG